MATMLSPEVARRLQDKGILPSECIEFRIEVKRGEPIRIYSVSFVAQEQLEEILKMLDEVPPETVQDIVRTMVLKTRLQERSVTV